MKELFEECNDGRPNSCRLYRSPVLKRKAHIRQRNIKVRCLTAITIQKTNTFKRSHIAERWTKPGRRELCGKGCIYQKSVRSNPSIYRVGFIVLTARCFSHG